MKLHALYAHSDEYQPRDGNKFSRIKTVKGNKHHKDDDIDGRLTEKTKMSMLLTWNNPDFFRHFLIFLPQKDWARYQQVCMTFYKVLMPRMIHRVNSLSHEELLGFIQEPAVELFRSKTITNMHLLGDSKLLVSRDSQTTEVIEMADGAAVQTLDELWLKRVTLSCSVAEDLVILVTDCRTISLVSIESNQIICQKQLKFHVTALCHVFGHTVLMADSNGWLFSFDLAQGEFKELFSMSRHQQMT